MLYRKIGSEKTKMKKIVMVGIGIAMIVILSVTAAALIPAPEQAKDNSPVIDENGGLIPPGLEKIVFVHYKKGFGKPDWIGQGKEKSPKCYGFLVKGAKWKDLPQSYVIHPDLDTSAIVNSIETWDAATSKDLFSNDYTIDSTANWDDSIDKIDGRNEFSFGDYSDPRVIAVAIVWGYFSGPIGRREIIEFDVLFDTDFTWGNGEVDTIVMDLQNIATHEIGHGLGLGDIYDSACSEVTMYGYSNYGETKKRTLEQPDITGIQKLYGM